MKKQLTLAATFLFIIAGIAGCKKQDEATRPLKTKMIGKWQISKIETTIAGSPATTYTGAAADYFEFRGNENDEVEISQGPQHFLGNYVVFVGDDFNLSFTGKLLNCTTSAITDNQFEFTGTVNGSNPQTTEKYYLSR